MRRPGPGRALGRLAGTLPGQEFVQTITRPVFAGPETVAFPPRRRVRCCGRSGTGSGTGSAFRPRPRSPRFRPPPALIRSVSFSGPYDCRSRRFLGALGAAAPPVCGEPAPGLCRGRRPEPGRSACGGAAARRGSACSGTKTHPSGGGPSLAEAQCRGAAPRAWAASWAETSPLRAAPPTCACSSSRPGVRGRRGWLWGQGQNDE